MGSEPRVDPRREQIDLPVLCKFKLYSTPTNFYLIGRDEKKTFWRVLKIDRTDPNELNLFEDPTIYTNGEIRELKRLLRLGNKMCGGFKEETTCYGIIGFVKFLGPYYMLVIKKTIKLGEICGHSVYGIAKSQMIMVPYPSIHTEVVDSSAEQRYKNFYFSYTYHIMYSLQKNVLNSERGNIHYNTMFVWNANLTRGIRETLRNTIWTVALVYGFFQQAKCPLFGEDIVLTVIARRSRLYAGTRYLRRGVNDRGRVANDVETEQIVSKEVPLGQKIPIASVVQVRGSVPLYWSQETSVFKLQPAITLSRNDVTYVATRQHFQNLRERYGKPIIVLNLLKMGRIEHRENILQTEFSNAIIFMNMVLQKDNGIYAIHFDLSSKCSKSGAKSAFEHLRDLANRSLALTGFFFCESPLGLGAQRVINESYSNNRVSNHQDEETSNPNNEAIDLDKCKRQNGVLRTNCVDCLDRTNFAQYAHGSAALARQLKQLGITGLMTENNEMEETLMQIYQNMGDKLALQYGGSEAHIKMFSALRGGWRRVMQQRDIFTAIRRYMNNVYQDNEKQNAINLFLGHFQPQLGMPALWDLDYDQPSIARMSSNLDIGNLRPTTLRRSFSDTNLKKSDLNMEERVLENSSEINSDFLLHENELASLSSVMCGQVFPGSCSYSNSLQKSESKTKFTPAEEIYQLSSANSSYDNIFSDLDEFVASLTNINSSLKIRQRLDGAVEDVVPGFSNVFTRWVLYEQHL